MFIASFTKLKLVSFQSFNLNFKYIKNSLVIALLLEFLLMNSFMSSNPFFFSSHFVLFIWLTISGPKIDLMLSYFGSSFLTGAFDSTAVDCIPPPPICCSWAKARASCFSNAFIDSFMLWAGRLSSGAGCSLLLGSGVLPVNGLSSTALEVSGLSSLITGFFIAGWGFGFIGTSWDGVGVFSGLIGFPFSSFFFVYFLGGFFWLERTGIFFLPFFFGPKLIVKSWSSPPASFGFVAESVGGSEAFACSFWAGLIGRSSEGLLAGLIGLSSFSLDFIGLIGLSSFSLLFIGLIGLSSSLLLCIPLIGLSSSLLAFAGFIPLIGFSS